jgi:myotubularin-related protein 5/13
MLSLLLSLQVPSPTGIANSFKKLMRACSPSSQSSGPSESGYMTAIQESLWMDQLSLLMQLAGAVADLIDIQGSSVLVCLENGWDTTAQVGNMSCTCMMDIYRVS